MSSLTTTSIICINRIVLSHRDAFCLTLLNVSLFFCLKHTCYNDSFLKDPRWNDVNVISSLLKLFFRRLPDALLTSELYPLFIEADKIEDPGKRIVTIKKLVRKACVNLELNSY